MPFNPNDKFTCATVLEEATGKYVRLLKGSPQVVLKRAWNADEIGDAVNNKMVEFANRGFRSLGVALAEGDGKDGVTKWTMVGLLPLFDPPRHDTKATIERCHTQASRCDVCVWRGGHSGMQVEGAVLWLTSCSLFACADVNVVSQGLPMSMCSFSCCWISFWLADFLLMYSLLYCIHYCIVLLITAGPLEIVQTPMNTPP